LRRFIIEHRTEIVVCIGLFVLFLALYGSLAVLLARTSAFDTYDILFEIDTPRSVDDFARFQGGHDRTSVHPIFVLLVNPAGSLLALALGSPVSAAILLNAAFGGASVALAFLLFRRFTGDDFSAVLLSLALGFSTSHLVCGAIPGATALAACTLLLAHIVFFEALRQERTRIGLWILVGILCMGVTTTNLVQPLILLSIVVLSSTGRRGRRSLPGSVAAFAIPVVCGTAVLAVIQKAIYPSSRVFFTLRAFARELPFASLWIVEQPFVVLGRVLRHFFLINVVAPLPALSSIGAKVIPAVTFTTSREWLGFGWLGAALWLIWLAVAITQIPRLERRERLFVFGITLCLAFNLALHCFYGVGEKGNIELLLYSGHFTFLTVGLGSATLLRRGWGPRLALIPMIVLIGVNNLLVMASIVGVYAAGGR
jgi:hypothetical protein